MEKNKTIDILDMFNNSDEYEHIEGYDILDIIKKYVDEKNSTD